MFRVRNFCFDSAASLPRRNEGCAPWSGNISYIVGIHCLTSSPSHKKKIKYTFNRTKLAMIRTVFNSNKIKRKYVLLFFFIYCSVAILDVMHVYGLLCNNGIILFYWYVLYMYVLLVFERKEEEEIIVHLDV